MARACVITCSDAASRGEREDRSGPAVREILSGLGFDVDPIVTVADEVDVIAAAVRTAAAGGVRLIVTTGGTGISPRDVTPEAMSTLTSRTLPGFGEVMRATSRMGPLSRAQAAAFGAALIVNLPGSPKGATESLQAVAHLIPHALELLGGEHVERHPTA